MLEIKKLSVRTLGKSPLGVGRFTTGQYTGDGGATQAIVGVGFAPRFVFIYRAIIGFLFSDPGLKNDTDGANTCLYQSGWFRWRYLANEVDSLDADGFTVNGAGTLNDVGVVYTYVCFG